MKCERCRYLNGYHYFENEKNDFHSCKLSDNPIIPFEKDKCENYKFSIKTFIKEVFIPYFIIGTIYMILFYLVFKIFC